MRTAAQPPRTSTSSVPGPTLAPTVDVHGRHHPVDAGGQGVLHLHRLQGDHSGVGGDGVADADVDRRHGPLHRRGHPAVPGAAVAGRRRSCSRRTAAARKHVARRCRAVGPGAAGVSSKRGMRYQRPSTCTSSRDRQRTDVVGQPARRVADRAKVVVGQHGSSNRGRRRHSVDDEPAQRVEGSSSRLFPVGTPHHDLGDEVVVLGRDRVAGAVPGVDAHVVTVGQLEAAKRPRRWAGSARRWCLRR